MNLGNACIMETEFDLSILLYLVAIAILLTAIAKLTFRRNSQRLPPGPRGLPLVGNYFTLVSSKAQPRELFNRWAVQYGDIYTYTVFGTRFVIVNKPGLVKESFITQDINDRAPILPCNKALGRPNSSFGIIGSDGNGAWRAQRRLVSNVLRNVKHADQSFEELVTSQADNFMAELGAHNGAFFNPRNDIYITVANIINSILMGRTYEYDDEEFKHLIDLIRDVFQYIGIGTLNYHVPILAHLPLKINQQGDVAIKKMFDFIHEIIKRQREAYDPDDEPATLIQSFLKEQSWQSKTRDQGSGGGFFDDDSLLQVTFDVIFGGYETVSTTLCWYLLLMAQHPDVQRKVQNEIDQVVGRDRLPTLSDRPRLPLTKATMIEGVRVTGVGELLLPHRSQRDCKIGGYDIPRGSFVASNLLWLGKSPELWDDPEEFQPERFLDEKGEFNQKLEDILSEFGVGRRSCLGEQLARTERFIIFTHVLHRFTLELPEDTAVTLEGISGLSYHPLPYFIRAVPRS